MTERPNQRHTGVAHGTGLDVGTGVDGDEQVDMRPREMDWQVKVGAGSTKGDRHCHCHRHGGVAEGWDR